MESQTKKDKKHQRINPDGQNSIKRHSRKRENWIEGNYKRSKCPRNEGYEGPDCKDPTNAQLSE